MVWLIDYTLFAMVILVIIFESMRSGPAGKRDVAVMRAKKLIDDFIQRAKQHGTLGPPRMEVRNGDLFVVGLGQSRWVPSRYEGERILNQLKQDLDQFMEQSKLASPDHPSSKRPES